MFNISNTRAISRHQCFQKALLFAFPAALLIGIAFGYINRFLPLDFQILYVIVGYLIGEIVKETGHGIQIQFAVLAVVLTLLAYLIGDLLCYYGISVFFSSALFSAAGSIVSYVATDIFGILFRLSGLYMAYLRSRII